MADWDYDDNEGKVSQGSKRKSTNVKRNPSNPSPDPQSSLHHKPSFSYNDSRAIFGSDKNKVILLIIIKAR